MRLLLKFFRLGPERRKLMVQALLVVVRIRLKLSFGSTRSILTDLDRVPTGVSGRRPSIDAIVRSIATVSCRVPRATCLTQAVAACLLLARYGYSSVVRIGVAQDDGEAFSAHAWTEVEGVPVIGGKGAERFIPLPDFAPLLRGQRDETP